MVQIVISNLDEALLSRLRARAVLAGRSLEEEVHAILVQASSLSEGEKENLVDQVANMTRGPQRSAADLQREARDR
ncbi:MAG: plasmid stabilization protein [Myxococcales bacterium]|nr:plasmid stabilization protein [Myxococcales bacterium]